MSQESIVPKASTPISAFFASCNNNNNITAAIITVFTINNYYCVKTFPKNMIKYTKNAKNTNLMTFQS